MIELTSEQIMFAIDKVMRYEGYTDDEIQRAVEHECEKTCEREDWGHYICDKNGDGVSNHPEHDRLVEIVNVLRVAAGWED